MKELSIEEKAKRYDESLERARDFMNGEVHYALKKGENIVCWLFPELKESEDERIRKALLEMVHDTTGDSLWVDYNVHKEDAIAWLEKQGEHQKFIDSIQIGDKVTRNEDGVLVNLSQLKRIAKKQGEQKPSDVRTTGYWHVEDVEQKPTGKVEPKFHEGDWIVHHGTENIYQVVARIDNQYQLKYGDNYTIQNCVDVDRCSRLYDVAKDAKEGDVLYSPCCKLLWVYKDEKTCYVGSNLNYNSGSIVINKPVCIPTDVQPATKEQREQLEKAMADAGYTFDFEKKELKKVEQTSADETPYPETLEKAIDLYYYSYGNGEGEFEHLSLEKFRDIVHTFVSDYGQKPAWSEEELDSITAAINNLEYLKNNYVYHQMGLDPAITFLKSLKDRVQPKQEWSEEDENRVNRLIAYFEDKESFTAEDDIVYANWLKSLKDRYTWKPSDEQMKALLSKLPVVKGGGDKVQDILESLYDDLKKLREE